MFHIVLYQPEIPQNTGGVIRLCANTGCKLHLVKPYGFILDDKRLRRAGMDYVQRSEILEYDSFDEFLVMSKIDRERMFLGTTKASNLYSNNNYTAGDCFIYGSESRGLAPNIHEMFPSSQKIKIPMQETGRSLNLAMSVGIVTYEAWRQIEFA